MTEIFLSEEAETKSAKKQIFQQLRAILEKKEVGILHAKAAQSKEHRRPYGPEDDHRLPYKRDVDRIIHSKSYARYVDKTQVVYLVQNDHITHRGLHVQLVSNFSRGIAEVLHLNEDLVEAIALGHDVGHPPFGHEGEEYLSEISIQHGLGAFSHSAQSCRLFSVIEPLNLGEAVYDGFLCHDGGSRQRKIEPNFEKTWFQHQQELKQRKKEPNIDLTPATLEGALVKLCDTMSYIGRDIEDAIQLGIIQRNQIPKTLLGTCNREILTNLACDIIENSYSRDYIAISEEANAALLQLRAFNFSEIYCYPKLKKESSKIKRSYGLLFEILLEDLEKNGLESHVGKHFLNSRTSMYKEQTCQVQATIDYIATMTDTYFINLVQNVLVPSAIEWS